MALAPALRRVVRDVDAYMPVPEVRSLQDEIDRSIADRRMRVLPSASFAVLALTVALVGLSAAVARGVTERRRELAIRGVLGATPRGNLGIVVRDGAAWAAVGVVAGLGHVVEDHRLAAGGGVPRPGGKPGPVRVARLHELDEGARHLRGELPGPRATSGVGQHQVGVAEPEADVEAVKRALELFRNPKRWKQLQQAGMRRDFSWDASAREYVKVYEGVATAARENR